MSAILRLLFSFCLFLRLLFLISIFFGPLLVLLGQQLELLASGQLIMQDVHAFDF